jgi:ribosomal protein S18 acetylase RimI-like enzyme
MTEPGTHMHIRPATDADHPALWRILEPILRAGETYPVPRDISEAAALAYWRQPTHEVFVAQDDDGATVGTYYLRANQQGGGAHVANCGYMVLQGQTSRGVARAMCMHSLAQAKQRGFRAMQFNFVIATNERAVKLWQSCGFEIVGRLPGVFAHPRLGDVDALVMFQKLV